MREAVPFIYNSSQLANDGTKVTDQVGGLGTGSPLSVCNVVVTGNIEPKSFVSQTEGVQRTFFLYNLFIHLYQVPISACD